MNNKRKDEIRNDVIAMLLAFATVGLLLGACCLASCTANATELRELDPTKPIYQKVWGFGKVIVYPIGGVIRVTQISPKTIEELKLELKRQALINEQKRKDEAEDILLKEQKRGSWFKLTGFIIIGIGVLMHFLVQDVRVKSLATSVASAGGVCVAVGIMMIKTAKYDTYITIGLGICVVGYTLYRCRNFSAIEKIKNKLKKRKVKG